MSYELKFKRYTNSTINSLTGLDGEIFIDTTNKTLVVQDGVTTGGTALATWTAVSSALSNYQLKTSSLTIGSLTVTSLATLSSGVLVTYEPASTVGAAVQITAKNTQGGASYADFLKVTNSAPGASRPVKSFRLNSSGDIEIINAAYTTAIASLSDAGNLSVYGTIVPGAYAAGQVIKDTMLDNTQFTVNTTTVATSGSDTDFITYSYTPVSAQSYLIIHVHVGNWNAGESAGTGTDSYIARIKVDGSEITYSRQYTRDSYTFRTGTLFPLIGRYTNSNTTAKSITVGVRRDSADDSITLTNSATALWLRITEVAR